MPKQQITAYLAYLCHRGAAVPVTRIRKTKRHCRRVRVNSSSLASSPLLCTCLQATAADRSNLTFYAGS